MISAPKLTPHVFLFTALCSVAIPSFAVPALADLTLPKGAPIRAYVRDARDFSSISARNCWMGTQTKDLTLLKDMTVVRDAAYEQDLVTNAPYTLKVVSTRVDSGSGSDCAFKGYPENDPDFHCDSNVQGQWKTAIVNMVDKYGNEWRFGHETALLPYGEALPADAAFAAEAVEKMQTACTRL